MKPKTPLRFSVLGVGVSPVQIPDVIAQMEAWIGERRGCHSIAVTGMHGVTEAQHDASFKNILNEANLVVPDGMPLIWLARMRGFPLRRRVYGPELMIAFCEQTNGKGYRNFLYGGDIGVAENLARVLRERFPGLVIAGVYSPPFRPLTEAEDKEVTMALNESCADVLWVGLGTPQQERWMHEHRDRLHVPS
jgi:N-acetylglucosaminyldiphosphoundecaprenol N-acetyl-beta-D-mannosaminyltransferase